MGWVKKFGGWVGRMGVGSGEVVGVGRVVQWIGWRGVWQGEGVSGWGFSRWGWEEHSDRLSAS